MTDRADNVVGRSVRIVGADQDSTDLLLSSLGEEGYSLTILRSENGTTHRGPVTDIILSGSVSLVALARITVMMVRSMARGVIVDASEKEITVRAERTLPRGAVVFRDQNGEVQLKGMERGTFSQVVEEVAAHMSTGDKA